MVPISFLIAFYCYYSCISPRSIVASLHTVYWGFCYQWLLICKEFYCSHWNRICGECSIRTVAVNKQCDARLLLMAFIFEMLVAVKAICECTFDWCLAFQRSGNQPSMSTSSVPRSGLIQATTANLVVYEAALCILMLPFCVKLIILHGTSVSTNLAAMWPHIWYSMFYHAVTF